jgi:DNA-binding winged helix-turn-helix (wHTH) protein/tetratricopeptide (TPR) repeat protein
MSTIERVDNEAKPTSPVMRAARFDGDAAFVVGDWRIEPSMRRAVNGERIAKIDPRNMRVLQMLAERAGCVVSSRDIELHAWEGVVVTADSVYQSIRQLRRALGDTKSPATYIETVPRRGYRLVAQVGACVTTLPEPIVDAPPPPEVIAPSEIASSPQPPPRTSRARLIAVTGILSACLALALASQFEMIEPDRSGQEQSTLAAAATSSPNATDLDTTVPVDENSVDVLRKRGEIALRRGEARQALDFYTRALHIQETNIGPRELDATVASLLLGVAMSQLWLDDQVAATQAGRRAASMFRQLTPPTSPDRIEPYSVIAEILIGTGEFAEADQLLDDALDVGRQVYGNEHVALLAPLGLKSTLRLAQGRSTEAETLCREAIVLAERTRGPHELRTAYWITGLAGILLERGKYPEALAEARKAVTILEQVAGTEHPYFVSATHMLAEALTETGALDEAESLVLWELDSLRDAGAPAWRIARASSVLGEVLLRQGRLSEARQHLESAASALRSAKGWPGEHDRESNEERMEELKALQSARFSKL